jgi:hypothetical protein
VGDGQQCFSPFTRALNPSFRPNEDAASHVSFAVNISSVRHTTKQEKKMPHYYRIGFLFFAVLFYVCAGQNISIQFDNYWNVIGPFPRSMREPGADPLDAWGKFFFPVLNRTFLLFTASGITCRFFFCISCRLLFKRHLQAVSTGSREVWAAFHPNTRSQAR